MTHTSKTSGRTATNGTKQPDSPKSQGNAAPRLSLKSGATTGAAAENAAKRLKRPRKRIIRREELPAAKLSNTKKPPAPKSKKERLITTTPKRPLVTPSAKRLDNLNASLNAFPVWLEYRPLAFGVEHEIFRHIAKHQLSCSKRVVQRLLKQHTQDERYQRNLKAGGGRYHLDASVMNR